MGYRCERRSKTGKTFAFRRLKILGARVARLRRKVRPRGNAPQPIKFRPQTCGDHQRLTMRSTVHSGPPKMELSWKGDPANARARTKRWLGRTLAKQRSFCSSDRQFSLRTWRSLRFLHRLNSCRPPSTKPLSGRELRDLRRYQRESPPSPFVFVLKRGAQGSGA